MDANYGGEPIGFWLVTWENDSLAAHFDPEKEGGFLVRAAVICFQQIVLWCC